jgi:hypothetical protein
MDDEQAVFFILSVGSAAGVHGLPREGNEHIVLDCSKFTIRMIFSQDLRIFDWWKLKHKKKLKM